MSVQSMRRQKPTQNAVWELSARMALAVFRPCAFGHHWDLA